MSMISLLKRSDLSPLQLPLRLPVKKVNIQKRCFWGCARENQNQDRNQRLRQRERERERERWKDFHRKQQQYDQGWGWGLGPGLGSGWGWGSGWNRFESSFSPHHHHHHHHNHQNKPGTRPRTRTRNYPNPRSNSIPNQDPWEEVSTQIDQQFNHLKKQIEKDPYTALFGPRREPFLDGRGRRSWGEFWGAVWGDSKRDHSSGSGSGTGFGWVDGDSGDGIGRGMGMGKGDRFVDTTAKSTSTSTPASATTTMAEREPEHRRDQGQEAESDPVFDPITGRMVSKARLVDYPDDGQVEGKDVLQKQKASEQITDAQTQHDHLESPDKPKEFVDPESDSRSQSETADANKPPGVIMAQPPENHDNISPEPTVKSEKGDRIHTPADVGMASPPETATPLEQPPAGKESLKQEAEDLEFLNASDIRASYDSSKPGLDTEKQKQETRGVLEEEFDAYVDPAGRINAQEIRSRYDSKKLNTDEPPATPDPSEAEYIPTESKNPPEPSTTMYRILAYDSSTLQVTSAETSSSGSTGTTTEAEDLNPTEILARLNNPAKFLPHFASMHNDGYEIVSGGGDILVFKRVRTESAGRNISDTGLGKEEKLNHPPPPEYEYDHPNPESGSTPLPETKTKPKPEPKKQTESTFRKTFRRMFLAGSATAATCYAVGVVSEYFRTGGQGGYGIDGFTEFESERRRRD